MSKASNTDWTTPAPVKFYDTAERLNGEPLKAGELVRVVFPDGYEYVQKVELGYGHNAFVTLDFHGATGRVILRQTGVLVSRGVK